MCPDDANIIESEGYYQAQCPAVRHISHPAGCSENCYALRHGVTAEPPGASRAVVPCGKQVGSNTPGTVRPDMPCGME